MSGRSELRNEGMGTKMKNLTAITGLAAAVAAELKAEKLILATGAPGILEDINDPLSLISYIDRAALDQLKADGKLADGMLPKAAAIDAALANGVSRVAADAAPAYPYMAAASCAHISA